MSDDRRNEDAHDTNGECLEGLGVQIRYDRHRPEDEPRWVVWIPSVARGDGFSVREAAANLRAKLRAV